MRFCLSVFAACVVAACASVPAVAAPTAADDGAYQALGRVFPDPLAACSQIGSDPCSPNAQGNVPATQFIQYTEFVAALKYMNAKPEWQRYLEVWPLDGKEGDGAGTDPAAAFTGNNLGSFEFTPKPEYQSAGLPTTDINRKKSDIFMLRVTDETVPDAGKKRYALSLSIHGIERAGLEGGTRAMEDLVTAVTTGKLDSPIVPAGVTDTPPTFRDVLRKTIIYFTYPNPDGWRRGSVSEGGVFFQRYNGNGVDVNRDWPDIGFSFRPYSGLSEPESRAISSVLTQIRDTKAPFNAGDDLHGMPFADALSYTLLPHGRHDFGKDLRIRETAKAIHRASEKALLWSPLIQPNSAEQDGSAAPCGPGTPVGQPCARIYGQTWGTVYDTINYTTTGALGDWFDSSVGLNADGIDNEMAFSHLDKNINFDPHTEQLHVDGNKSLIYAHLAEMLNPKTGDVRGGGRKAYVPNLRLKRARKEFQSAPPPGTVAQDDIPNAGPGTPDPTADGNIVIPFTVKRGPQGGGVNIYNGGMRVDITKESLQGISAAVATLSVQCKGCDEHPGVADDDEWVTVQEDFNQAPTYLQAGLTAAVNRPQAFKKDGTPVQWRAVVSQPAVAARMNVDFTQGPASTDGATGGDDPPFVAAYDVANTDFFDDLNKFIPDAGERFGQVSPRAVIDASGLGPLQGLTTLVLADDPLPGYTGIYKGEEAAPTPKPPPTGPPTTDKTFSGGAGTVPGFGSGQDGTFDEYEFTTGDNDANKSFTVRIQWTSTTDDLDLTVYREIPDGADAGTDPDRVEMDSDGSSPPGNSEVVKVDNPPAGTYIAYVDNFAAANPSYNGTVTFEAAAPGEPAPTGTGSFTPAEKDAWFAKLKSWTEGGGNLILTDGALRALGELTGDGALAGQRKTVYAGQLAFSTADDDDTTDDPLAANVGQDGARFNSGKRRQTYEPTPVGFNIQNGSANASNAVQYDVDLAKFKGLSNGRVAATSVSASPSAAAPVTTRAALGEYTLGSGRVRIAGALLPQPTEQWDHTLGLEPYAVTYTGYIVMCNLIGADCGPHAASTQSGGLSPSQTGTGGSAGGSSSTGTTCRDRIAPVSRIASLRRTRTRLTFAGRSSDRGCGAKGAGLVRRVYVAIYRPVRRGCRYVKANGRLSARRRCDRPILLRARGTTRWSLSLKVRLPRGPYAAWAVGFDSGNNQERGRLNARRKTFRIR